MPHLLECQLFSFQRLIDPQARGACSLAQLFRDHFPISHPENNHTLEFDSFSLGEPDASCEECLERSTTFDAPLSARFRLTIRQPGGYLAVLSEEQVSLARLPMMTTDGSFIIHGVERVLVPQLVPDSDRVDLANCQVTTVASLLTGYLSKGLTQVGKLARQRLGMIRSPRGASIEEVLTSRALQVAIHVCFQMPYISFVTDQTNPLANATAKRRVRLSPFALNGEGSSGREPLAAHYGRICPIDTPAGTKQGLLTSLAAYARINDMGFIETPYRELKDGWPSGNMLWLAAGEEEGMAITSSTSLAFGPAMSEDGVLSRKGEDYELVRQNVVDLVDLAPEQPFSIAASLIPFLSHTGPKRALVGANLYRSSVPLLFPQAPLVGTGLEEKVVRDTCAVIVAKRAGVVTRVTGDEIVVGLGTGSLEGPPGGQPLAQFIERDRYRVKKFWRTNQGTVINQRPLVQQGDRVKAGQIIADGAATEGGELALGSNVLVAYMPWYGHNFKDAVVLSRRLVQEDTFTSIHISEFVVEVRDTRRGPEEVTREVPNASVESVVDLDDFGVVKRGALVRPGDILVGKITPKGETELSSEEKLLTAIFGEKARDVKDESLRAPSGTSGVVIDVKVFGRGDEPLTKADRARRVSEAQRHAQREIDEALSVRERELRYLLMDAEVELMLCAGSVEEFWPSGTRVTPTNAWLIDFRRIDLKTLRLASAELNRQVRATIDTAERERGKIEKRAKDQIDKILQPDELPPGVIQRVKVHIAEKRKISVGDKMAGRHGNNGIVARIVPEEDMPFLPDGSPVDIVLNPVGVPSRMNVGQILETHLGWAARILGFKAKTPGFYGADEAEIGVLTRLASLQVAQQSLGLNSRLAVPSGQQLEAFIEDLRKLLIPKQCRGLAGAPFELLAVGCDSTESQELLSSLKRFLDEAVAELRQRESESKGADPANAAHSPLDMDAAVELVLKSANLTSSGKVWLRDGLTGEEFKAPVTVGSIYLTKVMPLGESKFQARSIGAYAPSNQQPTAANGQSCGQRLGEMELWALQAYGAAHVVQEMLTVKSDDVNGRSRVYEALVKGNNLPEPGIPDSFQSLVRELNGMGLKITLGNSKTDGD